MLTCSFDSFLKTGAHPDKQDICCWLRRGGVRLSAPNSPISILSSQFLSPPPTPPPTFFYLHLFCNKWLIWFLPLSQRQGSSSVAGGPRKKKRLLMQDLCVVCNTYERLTKIGAPSPRRVHLTIPPSHHVWFALDPWPICFMWSCAQGRTSHTHLADSWVIPPLQVSAAFWTPARNLSGTGQAAGKKWSHTFRAPQLHF